MGNKITIAGLEFEPKFCKKINKDPIDVWEVSRIPLANIYNSEDSGTYAVNIIIHIPVNFKTIQNPNQSSFELISKDLKNKIYFSYNGVSTIETEISTVTDSDIILCRNFGIDYETYNELEPMTYDLFHIKIHYSIKENYGQSVEAIIVHDNNLDPETSRGTVTTVRTGTN
ncbi:hypothetical protein [uncultured Aquimarina sp.]|uniref:hypothetical protein n=1 Tax=uncultured Aquimarina sp. TaxID=575652 RepID=UPI00261DDB53|nr:hypothetical protein [uncultured Aquimarina sp.]